MNTYEVPDLCPPPSSRHGTSEAAAERIAPLAARLRARVLAAITAAGDMGMTDDELQAALGMPGNTERPRRRELEQDGKVRRAGRTRRTASGRQADVWVACAPSALARKEE